MQHRETGEQISLSGTQHQDLLTLLFANSLEAFPRCSGSRGAAKLRRFDSIEFAIPSVKGRSTDLIFGGGRFGNEDRECLESGRAIKTNTEFQLCGVYGEMALCNNRA